jgi:hypothetical protein
MAIGSWSYQRPAKRKNVPMKELLLVDTNMIARFSFLLNLCRKRKLIPLGRCELQGTFALRAFSARIAEVPEYSGSALELWERQRFVRLGTHTVDEAVCAVFWQLFAEHVEIVLQTISVL